MSHPGVYRCSTGQATNSSQPTQTTVTHRNLLRSLARFGRDFIKRGSQQGQRYALGASQNRGGSAPDRSYGQTPRKKAPQHGAATSTRYRTVTATRRAQHQQAHRTSPPQRHRAVTSTRYRTLTSTRHVQRPTYHPHDRTATRYRTVTAHRSRTSHHAQTFTRHKTVTVHKTHKAPYHRPTTRHPGYHPHTITQRKTVTRHISPHKPTVGVARPAAAPKGHTSVPAPRLTAAPAGSAHPQPASGQAALSGPGSGTGSGAGGGDGRGSDTLAQGGSGGTDPSAGSGGNGPAGAAALAGQENQDRAEGRTPPPASPKLGNVGAAVNSDGALLLRPTAPAPARTGPGSEGASADPFAVPQGGEVPQRPSLGQPGPQAGYPQVKGSTGTQDSAQDEHLRQPQQHAPASDGAPPGPPQGPYGYPVPWPYPVYQPQPQQVTVQPVIVTQVVVQPLIITQKEQVLVTQLVTVAAPQQPAQVIIEHDAPAQPIVITQLQPVFYTQTVVQQVTAAPIVVTQDRPVYFTQTAYQPAPQAPAAAPTPIVISIINNNDNYINAGAPVVAPSSYWEQGHDKMRVVVVTKEVTVIVTPSAGDGAQASSTEDAAPTAMETAAIAPPAAGAATVTVLKTEILTSAAQSVVTASPAAKPAQDVVMANAGKIDDHAEAAASGAGADAEAEASDAADTSGGSILADESGGDSASGNPADAGDSGGFSDHTHEVATYSRLSWIL